MTNLVDPYRFGGGAFSPTDIAGLELWYDQSDLSTLWQEPARSTQVSGAGDPVGAWDDKSGNAGHVLQTGADSTRPTYQTTGILFSAAATQYLDNSSYLPGTTTLTSFVVFQTSAVSGAFLGLVNAAVGSEQINHFTDFDGTVHHVKRNTSFISVSTASAYDDGFTHVLTGMESAIDDRSIWVDGGDSANETTSVPDFTPTVYTLGGLRDSSPGFYYTGYLMEVIWYDTALGTTDRESVEAYLTSKWSI
jgi:hypothetical protein